MTTETQTTEQVLAKILTLCKNNGTTLDELLKLPVLDAEGKIPAALLRIVGALSTGAVIESGDNANGEYIRFADGTQVCWKTGLVSVSGSGANRLVVWSFPAQFKNSDIFLDGLARTTADGTGLFPYEHYGDNTEMSIWFGSLHATGTASVTVCCLAIGKWK